MMRAVADSVDPPLGIGYDRDSADIEELKT